MNVKNVSEFGLNISEASESNGPTSYLSNVIITICMVIFFIFSFVGNLSIIATIKSNSHLQSITNTFIVSLCVSDLISTYISPLWLYYKTWGYSDWLWGRSLCKIYWMCEITSISAKILHIASFTAFRLVAVRDPFKTWDVSKVKVACFVTSLWICSAVFASPLAVFINVAETTEDIRGSSPSCSYVKEEKYFKQFKKFATVAFPILAILPLTSTVVCSFLLIRKVLEQKKKLSSSNKITVSDLTSIQVKFKRIFSGNYGFINGYSSTSKNLEIVRITNNSSLLGQAKSESKNEKAFKRQKRISYQIGLVVFSFILGYLPITFHSLWSAIISNQSLFSYWLGVASYFCMMFSECLNPIMYNLGSSKLRFETSLLLLKIRKKFTS